MAAEDLRKNEMMARLLEGLERREDIGHYGRLVFAIVARHFLDEDELVGLLASQPEMDEEGARGLLAQVVARGYSPPRRERILEWQAQQDFKLIPDEEDPDSGNVYRDLAFPEDVYQHITEYYEHKASSHAEHR